jgi:hypothetical protein
LRGQNLFLLAYLCHLTPRDIDDLTVADFLALVDACARHEAQIAAAREG